MNSSSCFARERESLNLIPIADILNLHECELQAQGPAQVVAQWCVEYLCNPHPHVGRSGVVCPWSPPAMKRKTFWLTEFLTNDRALKDIEEGILDLIPLFKERAPQHGDGTQFKTIVAFFPDIHPAEDVALFHQRLKPYFLNAGLMLGEFFPDCNKAGLRNSKFHPLRSPIPLLVVREMLEFDIAFLSDHDDHIASYLRRHGSRGIMAIENLLERSEQRGLSNDQVTKLKNVLSEKGIDTTALGRPSGAACPFARAVG